MKGRLCLLLLLILPSSYAKTLLIGTTTDNPPFNSVTKSDHRVVGFDIDIMEAVCQRAGFTCQFVPLPFKALVPQLKTQKIDLAIGAIMLTIKRKGQFATSIPYLESNAQFITLKTSPLHVPNIKNHLVGVQRGTLFGPLAKKTYHHAIQLVEFDYIPELMNALDHRNVDVVLMDEASAKHWLNTHTNQYKLIGIKIPVGTGYGIIATKKQQPLMDKVDRALLNMEADGTYLNIYNHNFTVKH